MKFLAFLIIPVFLLSTDLPDLSSVLKSHHKAVGQKKLSKIGGVKQTGVFTIGPAEIPVVIYRQVGNIRIEYSYNPDGKPAVSIYSNNKGLKSPPWDTEAAVDLAGEELARIKEDAMVTGVFANYEELGYTANIFSSKNEKSKYPVIDLKRDDQITELTAYLDEENLVTRLDISRFLGGRMVTTKVVYSEYKDFAGVKLPLKIEELDGNRPLSSIIINSVETGLDFDKSLFEKL